MKILIKGVVLLVALLLVPVSAWSVTMEELIAGARKEKELVFIAGANTFGGRKGFAEIRKAFNEKYGLDATIRITGGPSMPAMAGRVITELKAGRKSSTDFYLGSQSHIATLHKQNALAKVDWASIFPWITNEMEIFPDESVLVYTSVNGILYNTRLVPEDKAPKTYEDLVDPELSSTWAGKLAIPPYTAWLVQLSMIWGPERVKEYTEKLVALSGGRLRYSEDERIVSGEFPVMANLGGALASTWKWTAKGASIKGLAGSTPAISSYFQLAVPVNSAHPNLARLMVAFMLTKEGQAVVQKHRYRSSHLIPGTLMANYMKESGLELQSPEETVKFYMEGGGLKLKNEVTKLVRRKKK